VTLPAEDVAFARSLLIHEDTHVLGFNKPAALAVQGGSGVTRSLEDLLAAFAKSNGKRPRLVHRLDRETSGVIIAARTVVCGGAPEPAAGEIALALKKISRKGLDVMEIAADGQRARTRYATRAATKDAALVELHPETGRMHQLRAHLAAIGRPIAGDGKYGGLFRISAVDIPSLLLHASALDLPHPEGGRLALAAPPPPVFANTVRSLELEAGA
jgi:tRNA pseudouridine32 synthase/23S rRNA pseudouridine746 synthase